MKFKINPMFFLVLFIFSSIGFFEKVITAFIFVFLHELTHLFVAKILGYKIYKIELFPFGGVAEYMGMVEMDPPNEILIALSGPLFNFFVVAVFFILPFESEFISMVIELNLLIGLFNIVPVLPLDGGRIFRSLLVLCFGFENGTKYALKLARVIAISAAVIAVVFLIYNKSNLWLLLVSFFIYGALIREEKQYIYNFLEYLTCKKDFIKKVKKRVVCHHAVDKRIFLRDAINCIIPGKYNVFYILGSDTEIENTITEVELIDTYFSIDSRDMRLKDVYK